MPSGRPSTGPITAAELERLLIAKTGADPVIFEGAGDVSLVDLGIDSLAVLELQAVVKQEFGLTVPDDASMMSVSEIVACVNAEATQLAAQSAGG
jgi:aromatase